LPALLPPLYEARFVQYGQVLRDRGVRQPGVLDERPHGSLSAPQEIEQDAAVAIGHGVKHIGARWAATHVSVIPETTTLQQSLKRQARKSAGNRG
jgi:hypothetical protein